MPFWVSRPVNAATAPDIERAYDKGRQDGRQVERAKRKSHPVLMSMMFVLAAAGALLIGLAAYNGSFSEGGAAADKGLNSAATEAAPVVEQAAAKTGEAAQTAAERTAAAAQAAAAKTGEAARDAGATLRDKVSTPSK